MKLGPGVVSIKLVIVFAVEIHAGCDSCGKDVAKRNVYFLSELWTEL